MPTISNTRMTPHQDDSYRRSKILLDATAQFCLGRKADFAACEQYAILFYSLIGDTNACTRKQISGRLARNHYTPRAIALFIAMETPEIAAPFLLISPVLWERDLIQLVEKVDASSLAIIARRSDINLKIAQALIARGDKLACKILANNPILKLNSLLISEKNQTAAQISTIATPKPVLHSAPQSVRNTPIQTPNQALYEMANASGKLGKTTHHVQNSVPFSQQLLAHAKDGNRLQVASLIAQRIGLNRANVEKLVMHESSASLAIFLKGLHLTRSQTAQLLLAVNRRTGRNIAEFTGSMAQYDRFNISQAQDIMRNLGARKIPDISSLQPEQTHRLDNAAIARRRQIVTGRQDAMFGKDSRNNLHEKYA